ncbi:MAG: YggT family protein [Syntrophomonadaceae bacterium]|nr:YggT family protein [Syntrophomonadaceae bacterium]
MALEVLKWLVIARCILSFVRHDPYQPVIKFIYDITEPVMAPFRRLLPAAGGMDFSPIVLFFAIQILQSFFMRYISF